MYTRITRSGGRSYLQIVEGFRSDAGVRQRVVANLGRLDQLDGKKLDPLIHGLQRALGRVPVSAPVPEYPCCVIFVYRRISKSMVYAISCGTWAVRTAGPATDARMPACRTQPFAPGSS
jgi:hypothetical protein